MTRPVMVMAASLCAFPLLRAAGLPPELTISNAVLSVTCHTADGTLAVDDLRIGKTWEQKPLSADLAITDAKVGRAVEMTLRHAASGLEIAAVVELDGDRPEFTVTLNAKGLLPKPLAYPHPFLGEAGMSLLVPLNEGIGYPVDDAAIKPMRFPACALSMNFCGLTDGGRGCMMIIETPDDAVFRIPRADGNLCIAPEWIGEKGRFSYPRRVRYIFSDTGGHVAICKRYREHARQSGLLKTLEEKRRKNPDVDRLVGAMNVWGWMHEPMSVANEMRALGMERILWSSVISGTNELAPATIRALNDMGFLTARYDNYQETMDPANSNRVNMAFTWVTAAWPHDRTLGPGGERPESWRVKGSDGKTYGCNAVCEGQALKYARERIPAQLKLLPYRARFVDTTMAAHWRECYDPAHPMTHGDCRTFRVELLRYVSEELNLVTGSENGRDVAVPYAHYFEGMLSLRPYRIPEEGRQPFAIWRDPPPEPVTKFQLGPRYRLPLWELVFHDCVVTHWWWGDCNITVPAQRELRDLWNVLYGTPPMTHVFHWMWKADKERFADTYRRVCPVARAVGYAEMTDHRFLAPDRSVQQTLFSNGVTVTVNFGDKAFRMPDGAEIAPGGFRTEGLITARAAAR